MSLAAADSDKRLKTDFSWVLLGNILYAASQWGIVLVLAKLGTAAQVGEYALGLAISAPVVLFANLQLRALVASDVTNTFRFGQYMTFRLACLGAALLITTVIAGIQPDWHRGAVIVLVGFAQALEFTSETYHGLMQRNQRMDRVAGSLILRGPLALAALGIAMYSTRNVVWAVAGLVLGRLLVLLCWDSRLCFLNGESNNPFSYRLEWNSADMLRLLRTALPLGVISLLASLITSVPRYFLEAHCGSAELGIFSAIASLLTAGNLIVSAFGQAVFLPVAKACDTFDSVSFRALVFQALAMAGSVGVCGLLAAVSYGPEILARIFKPEYARHTGIFSGLLIGGTVMYMSSAAGYALTAARRLTQQVPLFVATVLAATAISAWSIPNNGLRGAVDATLAAALVQLSGSLLILLKVYRQLRTGVSRSILLENSTPEHLRVS